MTSKIAGTLFFGAFAFAGLTAFIGTSFAPVSFWIFHGYWNKPPSEILFGLIFLTAHGGIGFIGLAWLWRKRPKLEKIKSSPTEKPWLNKPYWNKDKITNNLNDISIALKYAYYYFLAISAIALFVAYHSFKQQDYLGLCGLISLLITQRNIIMFMLQARILKKYS